MGREAIDNKDDNYVRPIVYLRTCYESGTLNKYINSFQFSLNGASNSMQF